MKTTPESTPRPKLPARVRAAILKMHAASTALHLAIIAGETPDETTSDYLSQKVDDADVLLTAARAELATFVMEQLMADREQLQTEVFETATRLVKDWPGPLIVEHGTAELTPAWARSLKRLLRTKAGKGGK